MAQTWAEKFYNSKEWEKVRELARIRDNYLCQVCGRPSDIVHHITMLTPNNIDNHNISLNLDNLMCLCINCHNKIHAGGTNKNGKIPVFDANGDMVNMIYLS